MKIDKSKSLPLYIQIRENIRSRIESGELNPLEPLPCDNLLCREYQVSKITVKKALEDLKAEGYIIRIKRKGTFVASREFWKKKKETNHFNSDYKSIAFIVPDIEDTFIAEVYAGIEKVATVSGFKVIVLSSSRDIKNEAANIEMVGNSNFEGAIIFPFWGRFHAHQILNLKRKKFPFVLIDRYFRDIATDMVLVDNFKGAYKFDKAGLSYPNERWTLNDFRAAAAKLTKRDKTGRAIQFGTIIWQNAPFMLALNGVSLFSPDNQKCLLNEPKAIETLRFWLDLVHKYRAAPTAAELLGREDQTTVFDWKGCYGNEWNLCSGGIFKDKRFPVGCGSSPQKSGWSN